MSDDNRKRAYDTMMALTREDRLAVQQALADDNKREFRTLLRQNPGAASRVERQERKKGRFRAPCAAVPGEPEARMMRTRLGNNTQKAYFPMPNDADGTGAVVIDGLSDRTYTFDATTDVLHFLAPLNKDPTKTAPTGPLFADLAEDKTLMLFEKRKHNEVEKVGTLVRDGEAFVDTDTYTTLEAMQAKYPGKDRGALLLALQCPQFTYRMRMTIAPKANSELWARVGGGSGAVVNVD